MKNLSLLSIAILFIAITTSGCKKETNTSTEQPISALFADTVINNVSLNDTTVDVGNYEFGFEFEVTKNGTVTQLGTKNPDADNIRISLWDLTDTTVIAQTTISVVAHTPKFVTLGSPVSLSTGKKYAISMQSNDWYLHYRTANANYPYPITKGNIKITKYGYSGGNYTPAKYFNVLYNKYIAGIADFTFETEN